jgi:hypothetical protein
VCLEEVKMQTITMILEELSVLSLAAPEENPTNKYSKATKETSSRKVSPKEKTEPRLIITESSVRYSRNME